MASFHGPVPPSKQGGLERPLHPAFLVPDYETEKRRVDRMLAAAYAVVSIAVMVVFLVVYGHYASRVRRSGGVEIAVVVEDKGLVGEAVRLLTADPQVAGVADWTMRPASFYTDHYNIEDPYEAMQRWVHDRHAWGAVYVPANASLVPEPTVWAYTEASGDFEATPEEVFRGIRALEVLVASRAALSLTDGGRAVEKLSVYILLMNLASLLFMAMSMLFFIGPLYRNASTRQASTLAQGLGTHAVYLLCGVVFTVVVLGFQISKDTYDPPSGFVGKVLSCFMTMSCVEAPVGGLVRLTGVLVLPFVLFQVAFWGLAATIPACYRYGAGLPAHNLHGVLRVVVPDAWICLERAVSVCLVVLAAAVVPFAGAVGKTVRKRSGWWPEP